MSLLSIDMKTKVVQNIQTLIHSSGSQLLSDIQTFFSFGAIPYRIVYKIPLSDSFIYSKFD